MHSTRSTIIFVLIMTVFVALMLSLMSTGLKPIIQKNEAVYNKKAVLGAVASYLDKDYDKLSDDEIQEIFNTQVVQKVTNVDGDALDSLVVKASGYKGGMAEHIDMKKEKKKDESEIILPVYEFTKSDGTKYYILTVRGNGLWDEIWANVALEPDFNTIAGIGFDHAAETPGLGAEIKDNVKWSEQFVGKKLYAEDGMYKSVYVRKGGAKDAVHEVDGITGATITADGVTEMLSRGLKYYEPYLKSIKG